MNLLSRSLLLVVVLLAPSCVFATKCKLPTASSDTSLYSRAKGMGGFDVCEFADTKICFVVLSADKYLPVGVKEGDATKKSFEFTCDNGVWTSNDYKGKSGEALDKMFLDLACDITLTNKTGIFVDDAGKKLDAAPTVAKDGVVHFKCADKHDLDAKVKSVEKKPKVAKLKCVAPNGIQGKWKAEPADKDKKPDELATVDGFCNAANSVKPGMLVALLVTVVTFVGVNL